MSTKITTGKVRFSYVNLFTPRAINGGAPKYSVTLLIPKTDQATMAKINAAIAEAKTKFTTKTGKQLPANLQTTIHDGDGEKVNGGAYGPECHGCWVISVSSSEQPAIVDANKAPIVSAKDLWSGCYGRAVIDFYVYDNSGRRGVSAQLNGIMKLYDGEPLSGGVVTDADWDDGWEDDDLLG